MGTCVGCPGGQNLATEEHDLLPNPSGGLLRSAGVEYDTLLKAFEHCDPNGTGYITDQNRFVALARLLAHDQEDVDTVWDKLDQDGNGAVSFPEFVEWAERSQVKLQVGLPAEDGKELGPGGVSFPHTWLGPRDDPSWNRRNNVTEVKLLAELQDLLDITYKQVWTRDRKGTGINKVPSSYELMHALHSENYNDWRKYYMRRHQLVHDCNTSGYFERYAALTAKARTVCDRHRLRGDACNEWLLFHGTNANSAEAICGGDFTMHLAGSATGTLYGRGTYFAESITKADEYARPDKEGNCCVLLCRVVGGRVLYNDEENPNAQTMQESVLSGSYHSILGDREKCRGTYKEYVVFDADQVYVEYALFYRRIFKD